MHPPRQVQDLLGVLVTAHGVRGPLAESGMVENDEQLLQHVRVVGRVLVHGFDQTEQASGIPGHQGIEHLEHRPPRHRAQHRRHCRFGKLAAAMDDGLIHQAEPVAQGSIRRPRQRLDGIGLEDDGLMVEDVLHLAANLLGGQPLEIELQAAGQHRDRNLLRIGRCQQKLDMRRGFFQGFEEGIEAVRGQHVHLVDDIDLVASLGGGIQHVVQQLAGVLDLGAGGGIDLDQIRKAALVQFAAHQALTAGLDTLAVFAVHGLGQNAGDGGLADTASAGKQIGVMQPVEFQRVRQCADNVVLTDDLAELAGSPLAGQCLIGHRVKGVGKRSGEKGWQAAPATSRHTNPLLPLLPSGPGGVRSVSLREDQYGSPLNSGRARHEAGRKDAHYA